MKIFVSYARVDKPICIQLVETLSVHDIWYDQRLYAGQHWWKEILRRLDWCEIFIYLISLESLDSEYCRKELDIARRIGREIIPIIIQNDIELPSDLNELQYIDMSKGFSAANVALLLNSILNAERMLNGILQTSIGKSVPKDQRKPPGTQSDKIVSMAANALEKGLYDRAVFLFRQAKVNDFKSRFININALLAEAEDALEKQARMKEAEREYLQIVELFKYQATREHALEAFQAFHLEFPDYDPRNLKRYLDGSNLTITGELKASDKAETLSLLDWCDVPVGRVLVEDINPKGYKQESLISVEPFRMSKYPVTNQQFEVFVTDPSGYQNEDWWHFDEAAELWFQEHQQPLLSRFQGDLRPRENVTWYEARAFANWLTNKLGFDVKLPTLVQWRRAAQSNDERLFPWGDDFDATCCNTRESGLKMTTNVNRYEKGISPYSVMDMAGNVWEWCLDQIIEESGEVKYAVIGGSYVSPCDRAQANFHYHLNPASRYSSIGIRLVASKNTNSPDD